VSVKIIPVHATQAHMGKNDISPYS